MLLVHANVFNHDQRIKRLWQLTKLSAVSAAFFSVTSSLDGVRDDRERQQILQTAPSPTSPLSPLVVPVTLSANLSFMMLFQINIIKERLAESVQGSIVTIIKITKTYSGRIIITVTWYKDNSNKLHEQTVTINALKHKVSCCLHW